MRWNTTKTNKERNFQYTHLLLIALVLTDRWNLSDTRSKSVCGKFSRVRTMLLCYIVRTMLLETICLNRMWLDLLWNWIHLADILTKQTTKRTKFAWFSCVHITQGSVWFMKCFPVKRYTWIRKFESKYLILNYNIEKRTLSLKLCEKLLLREKMCGRVSFKSNQLFQPRTLLTWSHRFCHNFPVK